MAGSCAARATVRDDSSAATPRTDTDFTAAAQPGPASPDGAGEAQASASMPAVVGSTVTSMTRFQRRAFTPR